MPGPAGARRRADRPRGRRARRRGRGRRRRGTRSTRPRGCRASPRRRACSSTMSHAGPRRPRSSTRTPAPTSSRAARPPVRAWQALRVVGARRRCAASSSLEAPFVGRARDLELIIDRMEDSGARPAGARLVSRRPGRRARASRACRGSSSSTSTGSPRRCCWHRDAAWPTARASRTGRSRRWCGCAAASPRTRSPGLRPGEVRRATVARFVARRA